MLSQHSRENRPIGSSSSIATPLTSRSLDSSPGDESSTSAQLRDHLQSEPLEPVRGGRRLPADDERRTRPLHRRRAGGQVADGVPGAPNVYGPPSQRSTSSRTRTYSG